MKNRTATIAESPEALLNDLRALLSDAELMLNISPEYNGCAALVTLSARFEAAQKRLTDFYTDAKKSITTGVKITDEAIRAHPYQALAIALGAGLLVGVLVNRSRK